MRNPIAVLLMAAMVIVGGSANVGALAFDELKAAAPADMENTPVQTPTGTPAAAKAAGSGEILRGWSMLQGLEIVNTNYLCTGIDDSSLDFCKSDWRAKWAADAEKAVNEYVAQYDRAHPAMRLVISYQDQDQKHEYPFYSLSERCAVRVRPFNFLISRGISYTLDDRVEISVYNDATVKTHELVEPGATCLSPLQATADGTMIGGCRQQPSNVDVSIENSSDGTLKTISYTRPGFYHSGYGSLAERSESSMYKSCIIDR